MKRTCNICQLEKWAFEEPMSDFRYKRRYRKDGTYMVQYDGKCKVCRRESERASEIRRTTQTSVHHIGPSGIEKQWFCYIMPTNPDKVKRYDLG